MAITDLTGRVTVITGAGSGIGRACAVAFAGAGADVVVVDVDEGRAQAVATEVGGVAVGADVSADGSLEHVRDVTLDRFGRVDVVMSNVGVIASGLPDAIPLDAWRRVIEINLVSSVRCYLTFLPLLLEQGEGHLVFTASTNALYPYAFDRLPYTTTKAAVVGLAESLALYTVPRGVGVTCLCPGPVLTNIVEQTQSFGGVTPLRTPGLAILDPAVVGEQVVDAVRAGRFLLLTHPEVHDILVRRAADVDAFLATRIAEIEASG